MQCANWCLNVRSRPLYAMDHNKKWSWHSPTFFVPCSGRTKEVHVLWVLVEKLIYMWTVNASDPNFIIVRCKKYGSLPVWRYDFEKNIFGILVKLFLAATKQLYEWYFLSVCLSVCLSHLFDYVPIIVSSQKFQELLPMTEVISMQKVKVKGQGHRSQPNLTVSGL